MGPPTAGPAPRAGRRPLAAIAQAFAWIGLVSFGGGRFAYFHEALVVRRHWLTEPEFLEAVAISQVIPGPNVGNLAAYLGQRLGGWPGAVTAVICLIVPGGLMLLGLIWLYFGGLPPTLIGPVARGVTAAAVGIAGAAAIRLRGAARDWGDLAVAALVVLLFGVLRWPIHWVLLVSLPAALLKGWWWKRS